ncbi:hypothetical protein KBX37_15530 [Micromonospora sp. U56]|uniref:hypothetical protein n=1 Tax=Micromonospora sp. U56 TaxID=2824900 RepID=UPI001B3834E4|nr:hypothetical protein [Micromonospora sp. U56]MBQ0894495.1 hypothetical protein [Micromonospora sp. U56]
MSVGPGGVCGIASGSTPPGDSESSVLHEQVGQELDKLGPVASTKDIAGWLGRCEVRWQETDNPEGRKEA